MPGERSTRCMILIGKDQSERGGAKVSGEGENKGIDNKIGEGAKREG